MKRRDRESWYLPSGSSRSRSSGGSTWTRVGLMVGLLLLVLGLMHRLSNPDFIQSAFRNLGAPLDESSSSSKASPSTSAGTAAEVDGGMEWVSPAGESAPDSGRSEPSLPPGSPMWLYAFRKGTPEIRRDLAEHFLAPTTSSTKFFELTQLWAQGLSHEFAQGNRFLEEGSLPTSSMETLQSWNKDWNEFQKTLALSSEEFSRSSTLAWSGFVHALDRALLDDIRDASPWRSHDRPALFRALFHARQQSDRSVRTDLPLTPSVLLSNSADAYRGRWVRLQGTIAKSPTAEVLNDPIWERSPTIPFGFILWILRLSPSASTFPIFLGNFGVASAEESQPTATNQQPSDPILDFEGIFLKRLVYRSKRGLDIAPVLVVGPIALRDSSDCSLIVSRKKRNRKFSNSPILRFPLGGHPSKVFRMPKGSTKFSSPSLSHSRRISMDCSPERSLAKKHPFRTSSSKRYINLAVGMKRFVGRSPQANHWAHGKPPASTAPPEGSIVSLFQPRLANGLDSPPSFASKSNRSPLNERKSTHRSFGHRRSQLNGSDQKSFHNLATYRDFNGHRRLLPPKLPPWSYATKWSGSGTMNMFPHPLLRVGSLWKSLGAFGVDLTAAERAKQYQKDRIHGSENESLMKLLDYGSVATETREWRKASRRPHSLGDLLREPDAHILQGFKGKVRILRAARIRLTDEGCPRDSWDQLL